MATRHQKQRRLKRGTFITPRVAVRVKNAYWPSTLSPYKPNKLHVVKSYIPPSFTINRERQRPARRALTARPRATAVSGMHDTPFKRPQIDAYGAWSKGLTFTLPHTVKVCTQRKRRREAIFAKTGGGSFRRKQTNRRTLRSEIGCKQ